MNGCIKMFAMYTIEYYSAMKSGAILSFETMWMNLENIIEVK